MSSFYFGLRQNMKTIMMINMKSMSLRKLSLRMQPLEYFENATEWKCQC